MAGDVANRIAHLNEAAAIAARIGECNGLRMHFGPTNVPVWRLGLVQDGARCDAEAIRHLNIADRLSSTRFRNDPIARDLVVTLHRRARRQVWELDSLCNRFGIGGQRKRDVDS